MAGQPVSDEDGPGDPEAVVSLPNGVDLMFLRVPEPKIVKNRVHICLRPEQQRRDAEVARIIELGATLLDDQRNEDGSGWAVLGDPEGNEFCVLRSLAELPAS
ncbi:hypothetical protein EV191_104110 [Tamaricihabitans halophyticus]|uniref:Glyoxalase-like domain-containing protein n=1 Tax=Tamaricihabitans halophyticus TaxID=1262583 RepID=A0A4R2QUA0_9PSEU|nr:hypothetical protein EV191_104110 [Tamaricihabitans halophyticus]